MSKILDHLNNCLERLARGEELESCLKDYPEEADKLRPLLKTASNLMTYGKTAKPSPQFVAHTQAKLGIAYQTRYGSRDKKRFKIFARINRFSASVALAIVASIIVFTGGFAISARASENAMPGQTLYPVKLATEQVKLTLAFSNDRKVSYLTQFAEARATEIAYTAENGDTVRLEAALEKLDDHLVKVGSAVSPEHITGVIAGSKNNPSQLERVQSIVQASSAKAKAKLEGIKERPTENKGKIIERVDKAYSSTIDAIEKAKSSKPDKAGR